MTIYQLDFRGTHRRRIVQMYFELKKILESDSGLIKSNEELEELILAKKVLTHDREGSDYRCHKKCNDFGQAVCRFRVYQPCEETFFEQISRPHSKPLELLCQIILFEPKLMKNVKSINHRTN